MDAPTPLAAMPNPMDYAAMRARAAVTNINEKTLLGTDYLNHFNEIIMLIELLPDAPDVLEDCLQWQPRNYIEHFAMASIADADLAVQAYALSPTEYRNPFDRLVLDMDRLIRNAIDRLEVAIEAGNQTQTRCIAQIAARSLRAMVDRASAIIHGETPALDQTGIDDLLLSWQ